MGASGTLSAVLRVVRLPAGDRSRALEAVAQLVRASVELRATSYSNTVGLLGTPEPGVPDVRVGAARLLEAERVGRAVARAATLLPWHPTCLRQALAVRRMLRRRGIASSLHLGVKNGAEWAAHAWVTVEGEPVAGRPGHERFVPLAAFG
jgi:transglutaminase superfamily protein